MKPVRFYLIGAAIFATASLYGCDVDLFSGYHMPSKAPERALLVGTYIFHSEDPGSPHAPERLTLKADGKYVLVSTVGHHREKRELGTWQLLGGGSLGEWSVAYDKGAWPIEVKGQHVRILIDDDLGWRYDKSIAEPN